MCNKSFWGDVGVKKWSQFLDSGIGSPIFGHLKIGTFDWGERTREKTPQERLEIIYWMTMAGKSTTDQNRSPGYCIKPKREDLIVSHSVDKLPILGGAHVWY